MTGCGAAGADHGGDLGDAARRFPGAPTPFVDLSTGINPVPYPFRPLRPEAFTRLPEPAALAALQSLAARAYGLADPAMAAAAPGTQLLVSLLPLLFPQANVSVLGPTYAEHAASWRQSGAAVREVQAFEELGADPACVLCNPNNPDGARIPPAALLALAGRSRLLVVDEAFADFEGDGLSLAPHLPHPGVIVLRSFGKAFGLAGLRLGFALAAPDAAALIRLALGPWAVSGAAIQIAGEALADAAWSAAAGRRLERDAIRLDAMLAVAGCRVVGGTRLFRLVEAPTGLFEHLGRAGIFVRRFRDRPDRLRFGIPHLDQWPRLQAALAMVSPARPR